MPRTRPPKLLILYVPAGGGHKAAARAVAEAAEARGVPFELRDALELVPAWFARAYVGTHLTSTERTPALYGAGFAALDQRSALVDRLRGSIGRAVGARLRSHAVDRGFDAIVSTHFFPLEVLGAPRLAHSPRPRVPPVVGVVTDYAAHAFWAEPGIDRFCSPAGRAARDLVRNGVAAERIVATGIPVRPAFAEVPPLVAPAPGQPLEVLLTSGGFGIGPMVEVIRSFAGARDARLTVICGDNPRRVAEARLAASEAGVAAEVLGFESDMPRRMAAAHVLVGKPGGLTVSEALAAGRPMVLVGACPGQELRNQEWLLQHGVGIAAEAATAGQVIRRLREERKLPSLAAAARALGSPRAADQVVDVAVAAGEAHAGGFMLAA